MSSFDLCLQETVINLSPGNITSQTVKMLFSKIFVNFGMPKTLGSNNGLRLLSVTSNSTVNHRGFESMESPIYHPIANELVEIAVLTKKRAAQAGNPKLNVPFGALLQRSLMKHRNTS